MSLDLSPDRSPDEATSVPSTPSAPSHAGPPPIPSSRRRPPRARSSQPDAAASETIPLSLEDLILENDE